MKLLSKENYRLKITFNFHVHHQIFLQVAENVDQNESFVLSKVTPASKVPPLDGMSVMRKLGDFCGVSQNKMMHKHKLKLELQYFIN